MGAIDDAFDVVRRRYTTGAAVLFCACGIGAGIGNSVGAHAPAGRAATGTVRTGTTGNDSELTKAIPIGRRAGAKQRVMMSLEQANLGDLRDGDVLAATAEVEVSVCLKPNELHGSNRPCIGRTYGYNPGVRAELVLAGGGRATRGLPLGEDKLTCTQTQPDRNHHCVLVIDDGAVAIEDASALPCNAETCHVNLVLSAHDKNAKRSDKLVVGSDSDGKVVNGDKGRVNFTRYRPGNEERVEPTVTRARVRPTLAIAGEDADPQEQAIYSVELPDLKLGEQLVIDGKMAAKIGRYPYQVFQTTSLVLSEGRDSASREGWPERAGDLNGQIAEANGFNCTQGKSAHDDPCVAHKVGVLEITRDSPQTLYVNLTAGMRAQGDFENRHRARDAAKILQEGFLRVYRYPAERNDAPPPAGRLRWLGQRLRQ